METVISTKDGDSNQNQARGISKAKVKITIRKSCPNQQPLTECQAVTTKN